MSELQNEPRPQGRSAGITPVSTSADHRVAVARERRERMRTRLLEATLSVWAAEDGVNEATVIRHVIDAAGVSRATFYKHFSSLDEAAAALGSDLSDEMVEELSPIQRAVTDPLMRASVGIQFFLWRGFHDRTWGRFVSRSHHVVVERSKFIRHVGEDLRNGLEGGAFAFTRSDAALTLNNGSLKEGIAALSRGLGDPASFIEALASMILLGFGVDRTVASTAVQEGADILRERAPSLYAWWPAENLRVP
ncbi:TetR/AcrR family transcriptional regulator [uncultured Sphingomonas sp.]|uniref:TetR/AcrR family transcriptional regulator n=1 Tax=uncultured Sphingomonas sp. TaxID=158754 RepID=UPI0035CAD396